MKSDIDILVEATPAFASKYGFKSFERPDCCMLKILNDFKDLIKSIGWFHKQNIDFFVSPKLIHISANWGTAGGDSVNTVLIFTLQEGVHCLYDVPIHKPNLDIELPLNTEDSWPNKITLVR